jgi:hypothetical protein
MGKTRHTYRILKQNPSWEMCSWKIEEKDNIKMDLKQDRL